MDKCFSSSLLATVAILLSPPSWVTATASPSSLAQIEMLQNTLADVAERVRPSVVAIRSYRLIDSSHDADQSTSMPGGKDSHPLPRRLAPAVGSGVIISSDGLILTNEHVIHGAQPDAIECILSRGERFTAQGITSDPRSDLAILRIDATELKPATLGSLETVRQGHFTIVMGNPFGSASEAHGQPAMSFGIVSALGENLTQQLAGGRYYGNLIQTDARINPGNSGGPLLNLKGEVIGITTAISSRSGGSDGVGYAIPVTIRTRRIIEQLCRGEEIQYGYLGIRVEYPETVGPNSSGRGGAMITSIGADSPAAATDLHTNDIVIAFAGQTITNPDELVRMVASARIGVPTDITVLRQGKRISLTVTPRRRDNIPRGVNIEQDYTWKGMILANISLENRNRFNLPENACGVVVTYVGAGTPAEAAGITPGNRILRIGEEQLQSVRRIRQITPHLGSNVSILLAGDPPYRITLP